LVENNYDILGTYEGATQKEIQIAFRKLALQHHSDRGGNTEYFKKIKQAYEDLKQGKKYPDSDAEKQRKSKVYSGDDEEEIRRRNKILSKELSKEMKLAEEWLSALNRTNSTATRLFGSKTLGEIEFERKTNGALSIKGNMMAGSLTYDGPIIMQGNITSPSFSEENITNITLTKGDFKFLNPLENKYKIENGSRIIAENGNIVVGNVFGRKDKVQDPDGKVGIYLIKEHRTYLYSPNGKIIVENVANTVNLDGDTIIILNMEDDVRIKGREVLIYGNKMTYDVQIELKKDGIIRFFEKNSVLGFSDDSIISLDNGRTFRLHDLKVKKIKDIPDEFVPNKSEFEKDDTMIGKGFTITYSMLDNFEKKAEKKASSGWGSKFNFTR
jgi:curved DNA-binding protein CbpA